MEEFNGPEFRRMRRLVKLYQKPLSKQTGVGLRSIQTWEQGDTDIAGSKLLKLLNAIGYGIKPIGKPGEKEIE